MTPTQSPIAAEPRPAPADLMDAILDAMAAGPLTEIELRARLKRDKVTFSKDLRALVLNGLVVKSGRGVKGDPLTYGLRSPIAEVVVPGPVQGFEPDPLQARLQQAQAAAQEIARQKSLAAEVPVLQQQLTVRERQRQLSDLRLHTKSLVKGLVEDARRQQEEVPALLEAICREIGPLMPKLRAIRDLRAEAWRAIDYMTGCERQEEIRRLQDTGMTQSKAQYEAAFMFPESRADALLQALDPGFSYQRGCPDGAIARDVLLFILERTGILQRGALPESPPIT